MEDIHILITEDDQDIQHLISIYLQKENYKTYSAYDGEMAQQMLTERNYQLIILDLMLPQIDGYQVLRKIRELGDTPVLIISAKNEEVSKIIGLDLGADDYVTKPFSIGELVARVKAMLRRYMAYQKDSSSSPQFLRYRQLELDLHSYEVSLLDSNITIPLTAKEFEILKLLMTQPKRVFTKAQIFQAVWQEDYITDENTVMVHISRLRTKLGEADPSVADYIQTVWGIGYKMGEHND